MNHQMFSFRFRLPPRLRANIPDHVIKGGDGEPLAVSQDDYAIHVRSINRYSKQGEAQAALEKVLRGTSVLGVILGYGIADFRSSAGDERAPGTVENLSVTVELDDGDVPLERALQLVNQLPEVPHTHRHAAEMYDDSCLVEDSAVALVLRTTGLEMLSSRQLAAQEVIDAIDKLQEHLKELNLDDLVRKQLSDSLYREKRESISKAVQRHVRSIVPEADGKTIKRIYQARSKIVHGEQVDKLRVSKDAENAKTLLRWTILRELGSDMPAPKFRN